MKHVYALAVGTIILFAALTAAEQLVIPKKKRVSATTLKENIGYQFEQLMRNTSQLIGRYAQMQESMIDRTCELVQGQKQCFLGQANKQQLEQYLKAIQNFNDNLQQYAGELEQFYDVLINGVSEKQAN